ncbi:MAG: DoxX family protein [Bacteroidota bacterium]
MENSKRNKLIYYISTGFITLLMLFSAGMYMVNTEDIQLVFVTYGYPEYIVIPLAIAKILALVAIWTKKSKTLKEWAYAGLFFDLVLAVVAHLVAGDGGWPMSAAGLGMLLISYRFDKVLFK